ncbi:Hypothetical_protein [Hexamita inflata]|uniref:Hypothetical_protein n=1 Tax=Hexamita inflata TaxID=28002 RepID=A0AA86ULW7_9EUKA|nr:Hypothetical protein HINF_LOCUS48269 [Hexamita inflata]
MEQYFDLQLQLSKIQLANEKEQNVLLQEQISNEKMWNQELVNELESKCNQLEQLLQLYETTTQQNDQIQQVNVSLQTSFQNCSQNNQSISINTSYTQIYTQQQNRINEYEKYIAKLSASNEKIKSQYDDLNSKISDKLQEIEKINSKDKEKALENALQIDPELLNCKNRDIQYIKQQYENVNRKYICAQDEYELMKEWNNQSQGQVQQLKAEITRLNEKLKLKENTCERLQSESKCPLMNTIQELQAQNQQYINHINEIKAQYSLQFQQSEKEKRNLIQEIQSQTKINENLTFNLNLEIKSQMKTNETLTKYQQQPMIIYSEIIQDEIVDKLNILKPQMLKDSQSQKLEQTLDIKQESQEDQQIYDQKRSYQEIVSSFFQSARNILGRVLRDEVSSLSYLNIITKVYQLKNRQKQLFISHLLQMNKQYFDSKQMAQKFINNLYKKYNTDSYQGKQSQIVTQNNLDTVSQSTQQQKINQIFGAQQKEQIKIEPQQLSEIKQKEVSQISKEYLQNNKEQPVSQNQQFSCQQQNTVQQMNEQQDVKSQLSSSDDQRPLSQPTPEIISKIFYEAAKNVLSRYFNVQSENMNQREISNQIDQLSQDQQQTFWEKIMQISNNYFETVEAAQSYFTTTFQSASKIMPQILEYQSDEQEQLNNLNTRIKQEPESKEKQVNQTIQYEKQLSEKQNVFLQQNNQVDQTSAQIINNQHLSEQEILQQTKDIEKFQTSKQKNKNKQDKNTIMKHKKEFDQFTQALKKVLNYTYSDQNIYQMSQREIIEFIDANNATQQQMFWNRVGIALECKKSSKHAQIFYQTVFLSLIHSENINIINQEQ